MKVNLELLNQELAELNLSNCIEKVCNTFEGKKVFSTSFGIEDQVITHALAQLERHQVELFTLDTGRQFPETYTVFQETQQTYNQLPIKVYTPLEKDVQQYVSQNGINGFYNSIEQRKACCFIRKVKPLQRALQDAQLWITGLRADQSSNREGMQYLMWDEQYQLVKFNPLLKFSLAELNDLVEQHLIPINSLYHDGFLSIGCAPCTRALADGESFRSGRWWWEGGKKECGLHIESDKNQ